MGKFRDKLVKFLGEAEPKATATFAEIKAAEERAKAEKKAAKKVKKVEAKKAAKEGTSKKKDKNKDITKQIDTALEKQRIEMSAVFADKMKDIKSDSKPPSHAHLEVLEHKEGVDFQKWNDKVSEISKRIANQT